ncbi:substrate-binding periplasmic protein [Salinivibrio kushneri]|uniref:Transporter substrate-binding domain-containing protein n=1 Tax=Salinivibrio kushneri TaxID=1908198 RepID=A0AA47KMP4_9GAMM|nr:transporter substrate-binding domain-containing protein [Salinivibrio kushneri]WBA09721.1 transporter substrate-binding domain-containing protein [Salinivibrio kushneri]
MTNWVRRLTIVWLTMLSFQVWSATSDPLNVCVGDGSPWPPYTYWQGETRQQKADTLTGYATDLVLSALESNDITYQLVFMPWARVQHELARESGRCDLTWDASYKPERAQYSRLTTPLYSISLGYLYIGDPAANVRPRLPVSDSVCGVNGYNYAGFGDNPKPRFEANTLQQALRMLEAGRCRFLASEIQPVLGGIRLGLYQFSRDLAYISLPNPKAFHAQISRYAPQANDLVAQIDEYLDSAAQRGELQALRAKYFQSVTSQPQPQSTSE